ncbi:hypothetical protein [Clostridium sp. C8-1-8]|nr:hypothetical protein [Clostridium sp. C8-1-8]
MANTSNNILDANKEEVEHVVANNTFLLKEMKEEAKKKDYKKGRGQK